MINEISKTPSKIIRMKRNIRLYEILISSSLKRNVSNLAVTIIKYMFLFGLSFVFLFPFIYLLTTSVKYPSDLMDITKKWLVLNPAWGNYRKAMETMDYFNVLGKTVLIVGICTVAQIFSCSFVAYGFARFKFKGRNLLFFTVILSIIVFPQVTLIPVYLQFVNYGFIDTLLPFMIPCLFGLGLKGGLFVFIYRQYFIVLPEELEEAARIDGCGPIKTFYTVILPVSGSVVLVTGILSVVWRWNDLTEPVYFLRFPEHFFISSAVRNMDRLKDTYYSFTGMMTNPLAMAGTVMELIPVVIFFLIFQRKFMQGVEHTGIKG